MFSNKQTHSLPLISLGFVAIALTAACSSDSESGNSADICKTNVTATSSPTTGALTLTGQFYADETVILQYSDGNQTRSATGTPATDRSAFTLTGLPSGDKTYTLIISCAAGQENNGSHLYTVK